jgi:hypothetical protein
MALVVKHRQVLELSNILGAMADWLTKAVVVVAVRLVRMAMARMAVIAQVVHFLAQAVVVMAAGTLARQAFIKQLVVLVVTTTQTLAAVRRIQAARLAAAAAVPQVALRQVMVARVKIGIQPTALAVAVVARMRV